MSGRVSPERTAAAKAELALLLVPLRPVLIAVFGFSVFVNLLMLTAPLYMLQVYDRVLVARSQETLVALSLLAGFLYLLMGIVDHVRARITARVAARIQAALDARILTASLSRLRVSPEDPTALSAGHDLDAVTRFWASPVFLALFDTPWTPVFIMAIYVFHPVLGWLAVAGGAVLVLAGWLNQRGTELPVRQSNAASEAADRTAEAFKSEAELVLALGMTTGVLARWQAKRLQARTLGLSASDVAGRYTVFTRTFRLFLQSAMLGVAAWLALGGQVSSGAMVAASILMGRALQPVEQIVAQWSTITRARQAHSRLSDLLALVPRESTRTPLGRPTARLDVQNLSVFPPGAGAPILRGVSFSLTTGQAIGVIGPSGSGKTALARALTGILQPGSGSIRLGGATLDQYEPEILASAVGYLPQRVTLFEGTVAENIARLDPLPDPVAILAAARAAAAENMVLHLPRGYDTSVAAVASRLSGGQVQRIGLARALYGDPVMIVLDEPNSSLDNDGTTALTQAIRAAKARGAIVLIMAHRPAAIQDCDLLLVLKDGAVAALGSRDAVLRDMVRNAGHVAHSLTSGGAA